MTTNNSKQTKNERKLDEIVNSEKVSDFSNDSINSKLNSNPKNENKTIFEKAISKTYRAVASTALGLGTLGYTLSTYGVGPAITSAGFMVGDAIVKKRNGEKLKAKDMKSQFYLGQIGGSVLNYLFRGVNYFATIPAKAAYVALASIPAYNAANLYAQPYVNNYTPSKLINKIKEKGIGILRIGYDSVRKNFKQSIKNVYTKPVPGLYASGAIYNNIFTADMTTKYALAAGLSTVYKIASNPIKKIKEAINNSYAPNSAMQTA